MTTPTHSPAEIRDAVHVLRGMTVFNGGRADDLTTAVERFTTAVRVAADAAEALAQTLEGQP